MLEAARFENKKLLANSHELLSQIYIQKGEFSLARRELDKSWDILKEEKSTDQLFVVKWMAIIEALEKKDPLPLTHAKNEALKRRHWESIRDLDFYHLKINFNLENYQRLYCGTPFAAYKEKLRKEFSHLTSIPQSCLLGDVSGKILDLITVAFGVG